MGQRNTQYPHHEMRDLQLEQGLSASGNTAEPRFLYVDYPDALYGNPYSFQKFHAAQSLGPSASAPPNFYNPCIFPSSSNQNFPPTQYYASSDHPVDSLIGFGKRKNAQLPTGSQHIVNSSAISGSSTPFSFEPGVNLANSTSFDPSEHQGSGNVQTIEGSRRNVLGHPPETAYFPHPQPYYLLQATHMGHSFHHATNVWRPHFIVENNIGGEACSNRNYNNPASYMHGRYLHSGAFELTNMGMPAFPDASSSTNATFLFSPAPLPNFTPHPPPVQPLPLQNYGHPVPLQAPYPHPVNNMLPIDVNSSSRVLNSDSRFPHFPSTAEHIYRLRQFHHAAAPSFGHGGVRILSPEDAVVMDRFYGVGSAIDQHQDMRMDTDGMSYEELLALGERIGSVKSLTEEYILNHLKTSTCTSQTKSRFSQEIETCIICQVEYNEDEIIGTLDCGHDYHGECIRRWLVEKNTCPICKKTAFEMYIKEG